MSDIKILDHNGKPMATAYTSSRSSRELAMWSPRSQSADRDMLPEKATTEGRAADLTRNNGYMRGALQSQKDRVVGANYKLQIRPKAKLLGIDPKIANDWASTVEQAFNAWFDHPEAYIDAQRKRTGTQILRECVGTDMIFGEAFLSREWRSSPMGIKTCFQTIEPPRVCNPNNSSDKDRLRAGIELDYYGAELAYHVRTRHKYDVVNSADKWVRVPKYNRGGILNMLHIFEPERPDQTRGFSCFAAVVQKAKMMDRSEDAELEAAIINSLYSMVIESEFGSKDAYNALGNADPMKNIATFLKSSADFHGETDIKFDGKPIPHLFPGEAIKMLAATHPYTGFSSFQELMLRHFARGTGMSYEELSGDYTKTTYSSARAAMQVAWQYILGKRAAGPSRLGTLMLRCWADEAITKKIIDIPAGLDYNLAKDYLFVADWVGAGRLVIDETKAAVAAEKRINIGTSTGRDESAENGTDYEENLQQLAREKQMREELGLDAPVATNLTMSETINE